MSVEHFIETTISSDISGVSFTINPYKILQEQELTTPTNKLLGSIYTRFSFTQDMTTDSDGLSIQFNNLDEDSVNLLATLAESKPRVIVKAGYKDADLWTFVDARIISVKTFWEGVDKVTTIQGKQTAGINENNYQISVKEAKNIKANQILSSLYDKEVFDATWLGNLEIYSNRLYTLQMIEAAGDSSKSLEKLLINKNISYNLNAVNRILGADLVDVLTQNSLNTDNPNEIITNLTFATGLLSPPLPTEKGITFRCLLRPNVFPSKKVKILDDIYLVTKTTSAGDNYGGDWTIEGEAVSTDIDTEEVKFI